MPENLKVGMDYSDGSLDEPIGEAVENICRDADANVIACHSFIVDAAYLMNQQQMNNWIYLAFRDDGTTIWQAPDESGIAVVSSDGEINITLM